MAIELLSQMPVEDFLKSVFEQKKKNTILKIKINDLTDRLTDSVDLACVFQNKANRLGKEKMELIEENFKLNEKIKELEIDEDTSDSEDTLERLEQQHNENTRVENIKLTLQEKLIKIRKMTDEIFRLRMKIIDLQKENENLKKKRPFIFKAPPLLNYVPNKNEKWTTTPPPPPPSPPPSPSAP